MKGKKKVVLAVHGGAGIILRSQLTPEKEAQYRSALREAMRVGFDVLQTAEEDDGGASTAVAAVEAAVRSMEDDPLFNAGRGSVFAHDEQIRMDASIVACATTCGEGGSGSSRRASSCDEDTRRKSTAVAPAKITGPHQIIQKRRYPPTPQPRAGAVAGVQNIRNPISLARAVMERTPHVMLLGKGAEAFAKEAGVDIEPDDAYFWSERRWRQLMEVRRREREQQKQPTTGCSSTQLLPTKQMMKVQLDHAASESNRDEDDNLDHDKHKFGTVGCIALYHPKTKHRAQLAAATSTGGMTNQRYHRVGDSPIIGAGTYANHLSAVSCTGHGEHFIRCVAAHDIAKRLEYLHGYGGSNSVEEGGCGGADEDDGRALQKAVEEVIFGTLMGDGDDDEEGGDGGAIALDRDGNFVGQMNCPGMYHGWIYEDGTMETRVFWDECIKQDDG